MAVLPMLLHPDRSIGSRLYWACFWVYLLIATVIAFSQMAEIFFRERRELGRDMAVVAQSFDQPLAAALWSLDDTELSSLVTGVSLLPPVLGVSLQDPVSGVTLISVGVLPNAFSGRLEAGATAAEANLQIDAEADWYHIVHRRDIWFDHQTGKTKVGVLYLYSDVARVFSRIWLSFALLFIGAFVKAITLWVIFRSLFNIMLSRPMHRLAQSMDAVDVERPRPIDWDSHAHPVGGEVQVLIHRFNALIARLRSEMDAHHDLQGKLERQVEERTAELSLARERAEQARRAAEAANQAKSRFLAMMSHELRTPMTGVLGMMEILEAEPITDAQREHLRIMRASAETLMTILNDILDFSRIEAGHLQLQTLDFDLGDVVGGIIVLFQNTAKTKGLALRADVDPDLPRRLCGDLHRLRQILTNLVSNGLKFTDHGQVTVSAQCLDRNRDEVWIGIAVADTGPGIPVERQGDLFKPFSQLEQATVRRSGGTGLGLVVCDRLVKAMGGTIRYEAREGSGSVFRVELSFRIAPTVEQMVGADGEPAAALPALPPLPTLRILLVEDVDVNRAMVANLLGRDGHSVHAVASGLAAVEAAAAGAFDLILMDLHMPGMDGFEATRSIRALPAPINAVSIIALTADVMGRSEAEMREAGFDALLSKPVDWALLRRTLAATLGRERRREKADTVAEIGSDDDHGAGPDRDEGGCMLDLSGVNQLRVGLSEPEVTALYKAFLETVVTQVADIRRSYQSLDDRSLRAAAHTLKGTAANFAAMRLSAQAAAIQASIDQGRPLADGDLDRLDRCLFQTLTAVRTEFSL